MEQHVLAEFPIVFDRDDVNKSLRLHIGNKGDVSAEGLIEEVIPLLKPQVVFGVGYIEDHQPDSIQVEGIKFSSRILGTKLKDIQRVFPYILTIGDDLENSAGTSGDLMKQYYLETLGDTALRLAMNKVRLHLRKKYRIKKIASMSPGSLKDWPVTEQEHLFELLKEGASKIGVKLTESMLMLPRKSISGILFPTEKDFSSCQLCARERCPGRAAAYDQNQAEKLGIGQE